MSDRRDPSDYLCFALHRLGFICNREPGHEGDHEAKAGGHHVVRSWTQYGVDTTPEAS